MYSISVGGLAPRAAQAQDVADRDEALRLFRESAEAYQAGDFVAAAQLLERAHALHPEPVLLFNLGRAREANGDLQGARDAYQAFVEASPDAPQAAQSLRRIEVLDRLLLERAGPGDAPVAPAPELPPVQVPVAPEPPPVVVPSPNPARSHDLAIVGWSLVGVALAGAGAGAFLNVQARDRYDAAVPEPTQLRAWELEREAYQLRDVGVGVLCAAGAILGAGVVVLVLDAVSAPTVTVAPGSVALRGSFD